MSQPKVSKSSIFAIIAGVIVVLLVCMAGSLFEDADKHYPSLEEVNEQYEILKNWEKVAQHFGLTRRVIQGIRKKDS